MPNTLSFLCLLCCSKKIVIPKKMKNKEFVNLIEDILFCPPLRKQKNSNHPPPPVDIKWSTPKKSNSSCPDLCVGAPLETAKRTVAKTSP